MSNTITAYFKGRIGVAESVYQNDYGIVMAFDSIDLPAHFDCYFSRLNQEEALPGLGADNRVTIPNSILANPGNVTIHIPMHTGEDDSEVEYVIYFKVIGRARPIDDGTPTQMTAIERALALLSQPITNIEEIVNEALSFTGDTFAEMKQELADDFAEYKEDVDDDIADFKTEIRGNIADVEHDFDVLDGQFQTAVAALTVDSEVQGIRTGDDGVIYTTAGEAVRKQFSDLKSEVADITLLVRNWVDGSLVRHNNGQVQANDDYSYIAFDISKYKTIHVETYMASVAGVCFYDSNDTFLEGHNNANPSYYAQTLSVPSNAKYIKVSCATAYKGVMKIYANVQNQIDEINESIDPLQFDAIANGSAKSYSDIYNATISASNGNISPTTNTLFKVRKYAVESGQAFVIKGDRVSVGYDAYALASFSESDYTGSTISSGKIIFGNGATPTNYEVSFVAPSNGYLYLASYGNSGEPRIELYNGIYVPKLVYALTNANFDTVKIQAFGDSITDDSWRSDGTTWLTLLQSYLPQRVLSIKNEAVGGSHIGHGRVNSDTGKYHELDYNYVYDLMTNEDIFDPTSDIIVMFVGTNDFNSGELGQWGDNTVETFYGAARMICEFISQNTDALFLVVTPIARPDDADTAKALDENGERINSYGATLRDYADALIKTCEFYQFPVVDLFHDIGWNKTNVKPYLDSVGVHPSVKGSNVICANISSAMKHHLGI